MVISANDFYPFGMMMPGRKFYSSGEYRYGFNGKEQDSEIKGTNTQYDYGFRIYDPRLSKFLSVDPLTGSYPALTPYQFSGNSPITFIDLDGLEMAWRNPTTGEIKAAGPESLPIGSRNSDGWILFQPPINKTISNVFTTSPPTLKPALQQGSDNLASLKAQQNRKIALRTPDLKPKVPQKVTTVSKDNRTDYEKEQCAEYGRQAAQVQMLALKGVGVDPVATNGYLLMAGAKETVQGTIQQGYNVYDGISDGNYGKAGVNLALLGLNFTPYIKIPGGRTIGLAIDADLALQRGTGAIIYKNAGWQQAGLTKVDWGKASVSNYFFKESFKEAAQNADAIRFDVTNFKFDYPTPQMTNFEFNHIISNPQLLQKTTFIQGGKEVIWNGTNFINK